MHCDRCRGRQGEADRAVTAMMRMLRMYVCLAPRWRKG